MFSTENMFHFGRQKLKVHRLTFFFFYLTFSPVVFPKWLLKKFVNGFPSDWKALYEKFLSNSTK